MTAKRSRYDSPGFPPCYHRMPMEKKSMDWALDNGYVEPRQKPKQIISHADRPSAVSGGHFQYSPTERRSRSPSMTREDLRETIRERHRRESSVSTRRSNTASRASSPIQMTPPPAASTNQRGQRRESNASSRRRNTSSSASPSSHFATPPPRRASIRRRNTSSDVSPTSQVKTPPPRSTSLSNHGYSEGPPSQSPIDTRTMRLGSVESVGSPFQPISPLQQELGRLRMASLELELKRHTSTTQERSTPTPDRISAQPLQHGQVSPERVPKRPNTNFTFNAPTQTQRLHGAVLNTSPGHLTSSRSRSPSPVSPLQTSPALPRYHSSASPSELNPRQSTPRTTTSPDSTVPTKPRPKPSGSFKQQSHVDTSDKTSPK